MVLPIFSSKVNYYKNGLFWWSKIVNRIVGEKTYNYFRMEKRIASAKFYYTRQQMLYQLYVDFPDVAQITGIYPKVDCSHGFPQYLTYEAWRDVQENSLNSDGFFAMFVYYVCGVFALWTLYCYVFPSYWLYKGQRNGEFEIGRMRDTLSSAVYEDILGNSVAEYILSPHYFKEFREHMMGLAQNPDDIRIVHFASVNRKHKFKEHFMEKVGDGGSMDRV